jgi:hypothetical protein
VIRRLRGRHDHQRFELEEGRFADPLDVHQLLDLISEDDWTNVYAADREVRPPPAGVRCAGCLAAGRPSVPGKTPRVETNGQMPCHCPYEIYCTGHPPTYRAVGVLAVGRCRVVAPRPIL